MDAILGLANNPIVLNLLGLVIKFIPGIRTIIANKLIPLILTVIAWVSQIVGPAQAMAAGGPFGLHLPGFFGGLGSALWQAGQAWALNEMFGRHFMPAKPADSK